MCGLRTIVSSMLVATPRPVRTFPTATKLEHVRAVLGAEFPELAASWKRESAANRAWQRASDVFGDDSHEERDARAVYFRAWDASVALVIRTVQIVYADAKAVA
jgi:hypothetical protein